MFATSFERASQLHLDELRRQAYVEAQIQQVHGRPGRRIARFLRAIASRLDAGERSAAGPWREDFRPTVAGRA